MKKAVFEQKIFCICCHPARRPQKVNLFRFQQLLKEHNRIEMLVNARVRWELGPEGFMKWDSCGYKDIYTLAKAYGIK